MVSEFQENLAKHLALFERLAALNEQVMDVAEIITMVLAKKQQAHALWKRRVCRRFPTYSR
jgi:hypothetical protein